VARASFSSFTTSVGVLEDFPNRGILLVSPTDRPLVNHSLKESSENLESGKKSVQISHFKALCCRIKVKFVQPFTKINQKQLRMVKLLFHWCSWSRSPQNIFYQDIFVGATYCRYIKINWLTVPLQIYT
jgi:hypothetical protein